MSWCYNWQNVFRAANIHGRKWFSGMMGMHGWGGGFFIMLLWTLIIVGIVLLVIRLIRNNSGSRYMPQDEQDRAINILREKLARGEISQEEYEEKLRILKENV